MKKIVKLLIFLFFFFNLILGFSFINNSIKFNKQFIISTLIRSQGTQTYWIPNGTLISNATGLQTAYSTLIDGVGNIWISWWDRRQDDGDIYLQKILGNGQILWENNGIPIHNDTNYSRNPRMVLDGDGGVIIAWQDNRTGQYEIYIQLVNSQGQLQWGLNGKNVTIISSLKENPSLVNTSDGSFVVVWEDNRTGTKDIYAQKFNKNGNLLWNVNGTAISNATGDQQLKTWDKTVVATSDGGIVLTWEDTRDDTGDVYIQRLNTNGLPQWDSNGTLICNEIDFQGKAIINYINDDKYILYWVDWRNGGAFLQQDLYLQEINGSGVSQWKINGTVISNASGVQFNPDLSTYNEDVIFITWQDEQGVNADIYMQRFNASGKKQWGVNGSIVANLTGEETDPILGISDNALFIAWVDKASSPNRINLQKYDFNGLKSWISPIGIVNGTQGFNIFNFIPDGDGGMIITWMDTRNSNEDIYMLRLSGDGEIWTPSDDGDGNPPDDWWLVVLTITLGITIPAVVGVGLAALFIVRRRRQEVKIPSQKVIPKKRLTEEELQALKSIVRFFSILYEKKS